MRGLNLSLKDFFVEVSHCWKHDVYNLTKTRSLSSYFFSCLVLIHIVFKLALVSSKKI